MKAFRPYEIMTLHYYHLFNRSISKDPELNLLFQGNVDDIQTGSCMWLKLNIDALSVTRETKSCFESAYYLCEHSSDYRVTSFRNITNVLDVLYQASSIDKIDKHPMNSQTSCLAICGTGNVVVHNSTCICNPEGSKYRSLFKKFNDQSLYEFHFSVLDMADLMTIDQCDLVLPCAGNLMQTCGCILNQNRSEIYPVFVQASGIFVSILLQSQLITISVISSQV